MTEPSKAARQRAEELANKCGHVEDIPCGAVDALARYIQQVSDVAKEFTKTYVRPAMTDDELCARQALAAWEAGE